MVRFHPTHLCIDINALVANQFLPEDWVFPKFVPSHSEPVIFQPATFTVDFDQDTGSDTPPPASSFNDGVENDSPFGDVFISPNAASVSSLDFASDWVVTTTSLL
ncbi:hypothetical protein CVT24_005672 [Panaeolus cyanescens]|uniref:Uncharacterized protein n=1 Tax=Panaeolus cyanescens TaxID=181874 RepID=A0A409X7X3_9AGAR|nr:hypothetical protein CVT24_005672 [Panaeolus cyanescens]